MLTLDVEVVHVLVLTIEWTDYNLRFTFDRGHPVV